MKILKLKFTNLNSLYGSWNINFEDSQYLNNGIFTITGSTGSGKTTILDAICLALYGKTPRLDKVTKNSNEIMSRGTAECDSEVLFETSKGRFRARWSQSRAKKSPNGALQQAKHEITDDSKNQLLETKTSDVVSTIEKVTGMSFDRFTRSILIAQGSFAAFLQASTSEKSAILEQITGTEIYNDISIKTYNIAISEKEKYEKLYEQTNSIKIIDHNEAIEIQEQLQKLEQESQENEKTITNLMQTENELKQIQILENEYNNLISKKELLDKEYADFLPWQKKLTEANKAFEADPDYLILDSKTKQLNNSIITIDSYSIELKENISKKSVIEADYNLLIEKKNNIEKEKNILLPLIKKVRELDNSIKPESAKQIELKSVASNLQSTITEQLAKQNLNNLQIENFKKEKQNIELLLSNNKKDSELDEKIFALQSKFEKITECNNKALLLTAECQEISKKADSKKENLTLLLQNIDHNKKSIATMQTEIIGLLHYILHIISNKIASTLAENKTTVHNIELLQEKEKSLENTISLLSELVEKDQAIQNFLQARQQLKDGQECPLCGSVNHPFALGNIPKSSENSSKLKEAEQNYKTCIQNLNDSKLFLVKLETIAEDFAKKQEQYTESLSSKTSTELNIELSELEDLYKDCSFLDLENLIKEKEKLYSQVKMQTEKEEITKTALANDINILENNFKIKNNLLIENNAILDKCFSDASKEAKYFIPELKQNYDLKEVLNNLSKRNSTYKENISKNQKLENSILLALQEQQFLAEKLSEYNKNLLDAKQNLELVNTKISKLQNERATLFGAKNCDEEENKINSQFVEISKETENQLNNIQTLKTKYATILAKKEQTEKEINILQTEILELNNLFVTKIQSLGFSSKEAFENARLNSEQRKDLQTKSDILNSKIKENKTLIQDTKEKLSTANSCTQKDIPLEDIQIKIKNLKETQAQNQESCGRLKEKIAENEKNILLQKDLIEQSTAQKTIADKWANLNDLIGSASGKKYTNFAQGLTFEIMLQHANIQLSKMTDRYLLCKHGDTELEIDVIDNYQAGITRTTRNLSGGETFLVSLALALGLSKMASRNVRVDSLFLDEGFGTLDEESLENALETLSCLKEENKLIGIISHVQAIKERIPTGITLTSYSGGKSKISGPGVSNI